MWHWCGIPGLAWPARECFHSHCGGSITNPAREVLRMRPSQRDRVRLKLLNGNAYPPGISGSPAAMSGSPAARVWLGPGEWVLVPGSHTRPLRTSMIRDVLQRLELSDPDQSGERYQITRVPSTAMDSWLGPAVLHHTGSRTVLYCRSDQIAPHAADCLAVLAARTAEVVGAAAAQVTCQVSVARVRHPDLPAGLHPAVTTARGPHVTAHVCSELITHELTAAMNAISAGLGGRLGPATTTRRALEPRLLALAGPDTAGQG
jgi:hypothetical protein